MPKVFSSDKQKIGEIGEDLAAKFLMKHGFLILDRNYTKKWGELDIVAEKSDKLYFIEVKSVTRENVTHETVGEFSRETNLVGESFGEGDDYRPEENMHPWKMKHMARTIQTYLLNKDVPEEKDWQVDLIVVYLDLNLKEAKIKVISDIVL
jgi:Holliday junction resolvase-like predicted endonuclease